jgi:hypothetical protein
VENFDLLFGRFQLNFQALDFDLELADLLFSFLPLTVLVSA